MGGALAVSIRTKVNQYLIDTCFHSIHVNSGSWICDSKIAALQVKYIQGKSFYCGHTILCRFL